MRIIFDLGHPAHYHLYKHTIRYLRSKGDEILIVVRNREDMVAQLLREDGESYVLLGENVKGLWRKAIYMIRNDVKLLKIASRFRPDLFVSMSSPYSAHVSFFLRRSHISFTDTEISKIILYLLIPFTKTMITPSSFKGEFRFRNHVKIDSYKELAYLHPRYFKPDKEALKLVGVKPSEKFIIVRFSAYDASHDVGFRGFSPNSRLRLIKELSKIARVFISSEVSLNEEIREFELSIPPSKMHDLLSQASLYIGEGAVMASEAAILGKPAIFINPSKRGFLDDLENHGLLIQIHENNPDISRIIDLCNTLLTDESKSRLISLRDKMLSSKKDLTELIINEIESYRTKAMSLSN